MNDQSLKLRQILQQIASLAGSAAELSGGDSASTQIASPTCKPKQLPPHLRSSASKNAVRINPMNHPLMGLSRQSISGRILTPDELTLLTSKYWQSGGVHLTVGFLDSPSSELRSRILSHMNAWSSTANVKFVETATDPQVRIARTSGDGYWSYVGTDILSIPSNEPTMNLDSFTMNTPESEYHRVVRHETGHTLGFPHEHMRRELVEKIDADKAIAFFGATQGWTPDEVRQQVLTPLEDTQILGTDADPNSIMCHHIPGSITKDGQDILGGLDIDTSDFEFAAKVYPALGSGFGQKLLEMPNLERFRSPSNSGVVARDGQAVRVASVVSVVPHTFSFRENSNTPGRFLEQSVVVSVPAGTGFFVVINSFTGGFTTPNFQFLTERPLGQFSIGVGLRGNNFVCTVRLSDSNSDDPISIDVSAIVVFFN